VEGGLPRSIGMQARVGLHLQLPNPCLRLRRRAHRQAGTAPFLRGIDFPDDRDAFVHCSLILFLNLWLIKHLIIRLKIRIY
jgi:hypothetical protein